MSIESMEHDFHRKVSQKIRLSSEGIDRFRVLTPFLLEDGDHPVIVLEKEGARWVLSDEAHTYMHLTYDIEEKDLHRGSRQMIISSTLATFGIEDREGELVLEIPEERYGDALHAFVQGLLKIADLSSAPPHTQDTTFRASIDQDAHPHPSVRSVLSSRHVGSGNENISRSGQHDLESHSRADDTLPAVHGPSGRRRTPTPTRSR